MPTQVQFRRGTTAQNDSFTGAAGELSIDTQVKTIRVHDGTTQGGTALATTSYVDTAVSNIVDSAPDALNTLNELAAAIQDNPNYFSTTANLISQAFNQANTAFDTANTKTVAADLTTANVSELTNLYFTNARSRAAITVSGDLSYDANTGVISFTNDAGDIESVVAGNGLSGGGVSGDVTLDIGSGYGITVNADGIEISNSDITALVTKTLVDGLNVDADTLDGFNSSDFALDTDLTTANVVEVTNLYYTDARAFANLSSATTTSLSEGNNLYFTAARAIGALASNTVSIGDLTITGNLFVQGDTVEVNTATLTVEDKNILLANGSINAAASDGAGITIDGSSANLIYLSTGDKWAFNKSLNVDGEITATGNVTSPFFYSESDAVLKQDVEPITNPLKKILKLAGVSFTWKKSKQSGIGVIAQDVEKIVPEIVSTNLNGHKTVSYDSLVPILIEAVKEQQKQIDYLKSKLK